MTTLVDLSKMIRPYRDCEVLEEEGEPREGVGWLDPLGSDVCETCAERYDPKAFAERMYEDYEVWEVDTDDD